MKPVGLGPSFFCLFLFQIKHSELRLPDCLRKLPKDWDKGFWPLYSPRFGFWSESMTGTTRWATGISLWTRLRGNGCEGNTEHLPYSQRNLMSQRITTCFSSWFFQRFNFLSSKERLNIWVYAPFEHFSEQCFMIPFKFLGCTSPIQYLQLVMFFAKVMNFACKPQVRPHKLKELIL